MLLGRLVVLLGIGIVFASFSVLLDLVKDAVATILCIIVVASHAGACQPAGLSVTHADSALLIWLGPRSFSFFGRGQAMQAVLSPGTTVWHTAACIAALTILAGSQH